MKKYIYFAAMSIIAAACSKEPVININTEQNLQGACFKCVVDNSKTTLSEGATTWNVSDKIGVFTTNCTNVPYATEQAGASVNFVPVSTPVSQSSNYYASYPYNASATSLSAVPVSAPYSQSFTVNAETGFSTSDVLPALAGSGIDSEAVDGVVPLTFTPVLPVLEFGFVGSGTLSSVDLELLGESLDQAGAKFLSGDGTVDLTTKVFTASALGSDAAKIKASFVGNAVLNSSQPVRIQLVTGRFVASDGLKLTFTYSDGKTSSKTIWSGKTVAMYNSENSINRHIYQQITVPAGAPSFLPDATRPIYIFGDLNGWNEGNVSTMYPMFKDSSDASDYVYKYTGYLPRGSYKFIPEAKTATGTYHAYCKDEVNSRLYFDTTGLGIAFWNEVAGLVKISIDVFNLTYSIESYDASADPVWNTIGVIGTINNWGTDWDMYTISAENNHIWVLDNAEVLVGSDGYHCVKFRAENDWAYSWQKASTPDWETPFGLMTNMPGAADRNIYFGAQAGKYKFVFNDISCHYWVLAK